MSFLLFNWEKCKILEIQKLCCSKTALGWGHRCFSNGFDSWRCRMSGFVVQGPKSDDYDSQGLKNILFPKNMYYTLYVFYGSYFELLLSHSSLNYKTRQSTLLNGSNRAKYTRNSNHFWFHLFMWHSSLSQQIDRPPFSLPEQKTNTRGELEPPRPRS